MNYNSVSSRVHNPTNKRRRLKENDIFEFVVFEQSKTLGGTWVYDERVGFDENGLPIHTSMYKSLRANLPKEVMGYPGYPIHHKEGLSYLPAKDILQFLHNFAEEFGILQYIKYEQHVKRVEPLKNEKWAVEVEDFKEKKVNYMEFDAVMVCNGHYNCPYVPEIPGDSTFKGRKLHSHDYRTPDIFKDASVVVIGAGPSGVDIAFEIATQAKKVILSHDMKKNITTKLCENMVQKPIVTEILENKIKFTDGSSAEMDFIFYCTGYLYKFPFLSESCGIKVIDNYVTPLHKHFISIENPTLCLIGLPFYVCAFSMFDLQARFFLKVLEGTLKLPLKEEMLKEEKEEADRRTEEGLSYRQFHMLGRRQQNYFDDLSNTAKIEGIPRAMSKLHEESSQRFLHNLLHYREDRFRIVNETEYEQIFL